MSPNEASLNLQESTPLSRNILHIRGVGDHETTGQRTNPEIGCLSKGYRDWLRLTASPKVGKEKLGYSDPVRDTAKSGIGYTGNRHLNYLVESIFVNVGEPRRLRLSMTDRWRARCGESRTPGSGEGARKRPFNL